MTDQQLAFLKSYHTAAHAAAFDTFSAARAARLDAGRDGSYLELVAAQINYDEALYDLTAAGVALYALTGVQPMVLIAEHHLSKIEICEDRVWKL